MSNQILLDAQMGQLPVRIGSVDRQQFAEDIASRLIIRFPSDGSTFGIGSVIPSSDSGPFFKSETPQPINGIDQASNFELYVWSSSDGSYKLINIAQAQLKYIVSTTAPDRADYLVWFKVDTNGRLLNVLTWDRNTSDWEEVLARLATVQSYFESFSVDEKGQIDWSNVLNRPNNIQTGNATGANGADITAAFDYQRLWHTGINGEIIFNPSFGGWQTAAGVSGDLKFVSANTLGTTSDFNTGNFTTALGRNPGWVEVDAEKGRVIVAADATKDWSTLSGGAKIAAGSTFGESQHTLTGPESGIAEHAHELFARTDSGSSDKVEGFGIDSNIAVAGEIDGSKGGLLVNASGDELVVPTSDTDAAAAHNNIQPSIARFLLRKV